MDPPTYGVERLCCLQIYRRGLADAPVGLQLVGDALALAECVNTGSFERRHMDEHVLAAGSGLDESRSLADRYTISLCPYS